MSSVPKLRSGAAAESLAREVNAYRGERTQLLRRRAVTADHVDDQRLALLDELIGKLRGPTVRRRRT